MQVILWFHLGVPEYYPLTSMSSTPAARQLKPSFTTEVQPGLPFSHRQHSEQSQPGLPSTSGIRSAKVRTSFNVFHIIETVNGTMTQCLNKRHTPQSHHHAITHHHIPAWDDYPSSPHLLHATNRTRHHVTMH